MRLCNLQRESHARKGRVQERIGSFSRFSHVATSPREPESRLRRDPEFERALEAAKREAAGLPPTTEEEPAEEDDDGFPGVTFS
jgi:hypothetical protein